MRNPQVSITCLPVGPLEANCYILGCPETGKAVIIDPGGDPEEIAACIEKLGLEPAYLINTHGHFDHIGANKEIKERYPDINLCIHKADAPMLPSALKNYSILQGMMYRSPAADTLLEDGSVVECGSIRLEVIHTPGHTRGGICLVLGTEGKTVIFSGDTLFAGGIGRTDFPGGDHARLIQGIRERLFKYPNEATVFPGHGPETSIGEERRTNPFVND